MSSNSKDFFKKHGYPFDDIWMISDTISVKMDTPSLYKIKLF